MTCPDAQSSLSLYLYGELDFAREEELENHLAECAGCQLALAREKEWHTLAHSHSVAPSLDLLAACRRQLRPALARQESRPSPGRRWWRSWNLLEAPAARWAAQLALASFLLLTGFASARWLNGSQTAPAVDPAVSRIRDIQSDPNGLVRIVLEQESELTGRASDANVRRLLLAGARQADPSVRYFALEILNGQDRAPGLRALLLSSVRDDPNPAVRLAAIEGLRRYASDPDALETLKFALEHDDNPGVRSQAIDILAPPESGLAVTPAAAQTIRDVMRSAPEDEYVRARCSQVLRDVKLPVDY